MNSERKEQILNDFGIFIHEVDWMAKEGKWTWTKIGAEGKFEGDPNDYGCSWSYGFDSKSEAISNAFRNLCDGGNYETFWDATTEQEQKVMDFRKHVKASLRHDFRMTFNDLRFRRDGNRVIYWSLTASMKYKLVGFIVSLNNTQDDMPIEHGSNLHKDIIKWNNTWKKDREAYAMNLQAQKGEFYEI